MKSNHLLKAVYALALTSLLACKPETPKLLLPVFGEKKIENQDTVYHRIGNFSLTNQFGEKVTQETTKNKIYVANFFFATCQSICPAMSTNLGDVQRAFENDSSVLILSHSVNPLHDTVAVLNAYGDTYHAIKNKWHLVTGDKKLIYDLAKTSYLVNVVEDDGTPEGFLHSELLVLVDRKGRMRGVYDGTDKAQVVKLIEDIHLLKKENF